jgi:hypothetical protein
MELEFHTPATYRIRVKGHLEESWPDRLGGMTIEVTEQAEGVREITLVGWLADQAALFGVLNTLYGLHLPLLSVEYVDNG